jgi:uncharacterized protein
LAAFVDSSGLVKLYVREVGSAWMAAAVRPLGIAVSELAVTEVGVTLLRRARDGSVSERDARDAWRLLRRELRSFAVTHLDRPALVAAAQLSARSAVPVRALDALQLRGALEVAVDARRLGQTSPLFVSADARLLRAAAALGLQTENPEDHP